MSHFLHIIYAILNASVILERNEKRLKRNETCLARNEMRGGNLPLSDTVCLNDIFIDNFGHCGGMFDSRWPATFGTVLKLNNLLYRGQVSKETVVLRRWEYYKIIWFYQLG